ncbi:MAG: DUF1800 family protein, partial [Pyrinomonadaceae bacterium]
ITKPYSFDNGPDAGKFFFNARLHDDGEKIVLGHKIPAGGGIRDGLMVIDILSKHPSTASFIATKLARKFVMDQPTPELIGRIAAAFTKSDGDIARILQAIFTSPEFNSVEAYRAKIKTPFELSVSAIRSLDGETNGSPQLIQTIARMGEPLYGYQAPTGYPDAAEYWVNTGALLERLNFGLALASNRISGTTVNLSRFTSNGEQVGNSFDKDKVLDRFIYIVLQGDVSPKTREALRNQVQQQAQQQIQQETQQNARSPVTVTQTSTTTEQNGTDKIINAQQQGKGKRKVGGKVGNVDDYTLGAPSGDPAIARIVGLILGSPEFQRQ